MFDYNNYLSPYSWRYASPKMRTIWSEVHKRRLWREAWLALAEAEAEFGLVSARQIDELRQHVGDIDVPRSLEIESEIHHDLMAELKAYAEQCPTAGGILHLGATSMDIEDNADALRIRQSLDVILEELGLLLVELASQIERWSDRVCMAFTHLQPAEPTTLGYRLAQYAQDLLADYQALSGQRSGLRGKGFRGAVGTSAAYADLVGAGSLEAFEDSLSQRLGLPFFPVATQIYPRKQEYTVTSALAGMGASLYKFAFDLRVLQSPPIGEWSEPFSRKQVGSSAMPFKRNPINAEKIDSLGRLLAQLPRLAWDNAAHTLLERTLDDSANRRTLLPEAFLISDEMLITAIKLVKGLQVDEAALDRNLAIYTPFAATERVLMALGKAGADRQEMHERLREHAMAAWEAVRQGKPNPLADQISRDELLLRYLDQETLRSLMQASNHIGDAPHRAVQLAEDIRSIVIAEK